MGENMAGRKAFDDVRNIDDLRNDIANNPRYANGTYMNQESLEYAFSGLRILEDDGEKTFLKFVHHVDKKLSMAGTANGNRYHKIPTVLAGAIYLAYFKEEVSELTLDELTILSKHSIVEPFAFYEINTQKYTKELLGTIESISEDIMFSDLYMELADKKLEEGETPHEISEYMKTTPTETLNKEGFDYVDQIIQEGGIYL